MLPGVQSAREHVSPRADLRDRPSQMTYNEPRGQHADVTGDVTGQYRERYHPEMASHDAFRGPTAVRYSDSTQATSPGLMMPPWNKIPGICRFFTTRSHAERCPSYSMLSVCPSVTRRYCVNMNERRMMPFSQLVGSPLTLVFGLLAYLQGMTPNMGGEIT